MKKLLFKIMLFSPIVLFMIAVNYLIDPARLFQNKDYEKGILTILLNGKNVTNLSNENFDDRTLQKLYIDGLGERNKLIVMGSSRAMLLNSQMFPGKSFFNHSVSSAVLEDYIAIYGLYRKKGLLPQKIIIGVDPWIFNKNNHVEKWESYKDIYNETLRMMSASRGTPSYKMTDFIPAKYLEIVSPSYFQSAILYLRTKNRNTNDKAHWYESTDKDLNEQQTICFDGSRTIERKRRELSVSEVKGNTAKEIAEDGRGCLSSFIELDRDLKDKFNAFLRLAKNDGVEIVFFLSPYHPDFYQYLTRPDKLNSISIKVVEEYLREVSKDYRIKIVGSYNPHDFPVTEDEFCDVMHFRDEVPIRRILLSLSERG